ncbi:MAG TPA: aldo/keto reductase [Anaerolineae bacterium]|nr:aldo/keto reductase [Anaerolineae bacterium]HPL28496.1 aldo/keto reductase [Anaerolineae bacterium]
MATGSMPYRTLGRAGEQVSLIGLGGAHLIRPSEAEAIRIVRTALDEGINFLDNSWDYGEGVSEARMGKALRDGYRRRAFVMTKFDSRRRGGALRQIEDSLRRLGVDTIDLLQVHEVIRPEDPERVFAPGGCIEALLEAQRAGKVRYIGFTGHKSPEIHLAMLRTALAHGVAFDTVQLPLNVMDAHYDSFQRQVLPVLLEQGIGVLAMKPLGGGHILQSGAVTAGECLHYAMNLPAAVVITGCESLDILEQALQAARTFRPLSEEQVTDLLARTAQPAARGQYELYKTSRHFDSTEFHREWLEWEPEPAGAARAGL